MAYINVNTLRSQLFHKVEDGELLDVYESTCMYEFASQVRCASLCLQHKNPPCVSFSYEKQAQLCSFSTSMTRQANQPSALVNSNTLYSRDNSCFLQILLSHFIVRNFPLIFK